MLRAHRLPANPLIFPDPHVDARVGSNIAGPSLIRVPAWVEQPLGRYYLYFSHHKGNSIRVAYAGDLQGPWTIYEPGTLHLSDSFFLDHIASPDVHIDNQRREFRLYYHGVIHQNAEPRFSWGSHTEIITPATSHDYQQGTRVATSADGLHFTAHEQLLGPAYFRVFHWQGWYHALAMPGVFLRSRDGLRDFERDPTLFTRSMRHSAVQLDGNRLSVYFTNAGDCPEHILRATLELTDDWQQWRASEPELVLAPELEWEGVDEPLAPSSRGAVLGPARQLRDPAIFREDQRTYLLYAAAGEYGIGIAELRDDAAQ